MDLKDIIVDKKEIGKLVGLAKASFTRAKTRTIKIVVDKIEDYEQEYFTGDEELARLVKAKQELKKETDKKTKALDTAMIERINNKLRTKRGYDAEELYDKRQAALLELLKDCLHEFGLVSYAVKVDGRDPESIKERLENMIKDMEGGI